MIIFGKITIKIDDNIISEINIMARNEIQKKGIWDYYKDFISNISNYILIDEFILNL